MSLVASLTALVAYVWAEVVNVFTEFFPPRSKYSVDSIPDLTGKVFIVTGANTGIGKETVKALLVKNATVYLAARDHTRATNAITDLKAATGKVANYLPLDLADIASVKAAAAEFMSKERQLHVLINNAAVMAPPVELLTKDGYDLQFGTNVLGHFYLTKLLLPVLLSTAESSPPGTVRVVNVSSVGHHFSGLDFNTFRDGPARRKLRPQALYSQSKNGNIVFAAELARRYGNRGIVSTSVHPGGIASDLMRHMPSFAQTFAHHSPFMGTPAQGALTQLWAATSEEGKDFNGKYLIPWARIGNPRPDTQDPQIGQELWNWCEEQVRDL